VTAVAVLVPPLHGHVNPALGTAAELVRRGHRVDLHLPERFRAPVEAVGARLRPHAEPEPPGWARGLDRRARFASLPARLADAARAVLPQVLPALAADPPDVLVHDQLCVWGRLAAAVSDVPAVQLCTSYAAGPRWSPASEPAYADLPRVPGADAAWTAAVDELARRCGTPRITLADLLAGTAAATVVHVPRVLHPAAAAYDDRYRFVGAALRPAPATGDDPLAGLELERDRPLAYVSMGTLFADWPELGPLCDAAFADGRWQVVLASPGAAPERRGPVRVRPGVAQLAVLDRADVAVTHAGMGSVLEALHAGVPLVAVPQVPEQEITADRLVALGAAVRLERADVTPGALRDAVEHVAGDARVRRAVQRLRHAVRTAGGAPAAADVVLSRALSRAREGPRAAAGGPVAHGDPR
jgi:MGT family glycosyltransferase